MKAKKINHSIYFRIYEYVPLSRFKEVASDSVNVGAAVATDLEDIFETDNTLYGN